MARPQKVGPAQAEILPFPGGDPEAEPTARASPETTPPVEPPPQKRPRNPNFIDTKKAKVTTSLEETGEVLPAAGTIQFARPDSTQIFRVHPGGEWLESWYLLTKKVLGEGGLDTLQGATFLVNRSVAKELLVSGRGKGVLKERRLSYWMDTRGVLGIWSTGIATGDSTESPWVSSSGQALSHARKGWVRVAATGKSFSGKYVTYGYPQEPNREWPDMEQGEVLGTVFSDGKYIQDLSHPAIASLLQGVEL